MNIDQLKNLLQKYNLRPNFTYGQNFLIDDIVLQDIVDAAEVTSQDQVLEIGPGIGNLTRYILDKAGFVLSVEKDPKFYPILKAIKKDYKDRFRFEISDILEFDYYKVFEERRQYTCPPRSCSSKIEEGLGNNLDLITTPTLDMSRQGRRANEHANDTNSGHSSESFESFGSLSYKVVASIPYYITGKILQMLLGAEHKPETITVLTQKEVARNAVAGVGDLSLLAISVQLYGDPEIKMVVPARSFYPAPKVDSAVLHIKLHKTPKYKIGDEKKFFSLLRACFAGKRKQIHNTLVNNFGLEKEKALGVLRVVGIDAKMRPQELSIEQWVELNKNI